MHPTGHYSFSSHRAVLTRKYLAVLLYIVSLQVLYTRGAHRDHDKIVTRLCSYILDTYNLFWFRLRGVLGSSVRRSEDACACGLQAVHCVLCAAARVGRDLVPQRWSPHRWFPQVVVAPGSGPRCHQVAGT